MRNEISAAATLVIDLPQDDEIKAELEKHSGKLAKLALRLLGLMC